MAFTGERFCGLGRSIMESLRQYWGQDGFEYRTGGQDHDHDEGP